MQRSVLVALVIVLILPGCGYKGPLTLTKEAPAKPAVASQPGAEKPANQQDSKP